jgi:hypothetical protein
MARSDYRGCDVCDGKAFYDANLNYEDAKSEWHREPYRVAGAPQYPGNPEFNEKYAISLDYVGDWAVICTDCSPRFRTLIEPVPVDGEAEYLSWVPRGQNEYIEGRSPQHVLKAEGASPDATDRGTCANASPGGGPMGAGQAAAAAPVGVLGTPEGNA